MEVNAEEGWVRKVGQLPPPSVAVPKEIKESIGQDAELYRRARINLNNSHGVGACAYLRRLLENRIKPMLQIIREAREEDGASAQELEEIDRIIEGKTAAARIELAGPVLPEAVKVEGDNPLKLIYDELSIGIHGLNEQKATQTAHRSMEALEYVLVELSAEQRRRQAKKWFDHNIRSIRKAKGT
jgi:hypothetical protein